MHLTNGKYNKVVWENTFQDDNFFWTTSMQPERRSINNLWTMHKRTFMCRLCPLTKLVLNAVVHATVNVLINILSDLLKYLVLYRYWCWIHKVWFSKNRWNRMKGVKCNFYCPFSYLFSIPQRNYTKKKETYYSETW